LREGCIVPSIGGGLCQLSNALYQLALRTQCEIVERHRHSKIIPGSDAERGLDATVFWNYVDLRFHPKTDLFIRATLTKSHLVVAAYGRGAAAAVFNARAENSVAKINECASCAMQKCFRHVGTRKTQSRQAFLLDECWPEYREFLQRYAKDNDFVGTPMNTRKARYDWGDLSRFDAHSFPWLALMRSARSRIHGNYGAARLSAQLDDTVRLAKAYRSKLPFDCEQVYASQSLLPFLWRSRALDARNFSVLMTRLPLHLLHDRLDSEFKKHPSRSTLAEFRAPAWLVEAEAEALAAADRIVTPHRELQSVFGERATVLDWSLPSAEKLVSACIGVVLFPGPTAARKGCYELRDAAKALGVKVLATGAQLEGSDFWNGTAALTGVADPEVVVQPALVEDSPRALLLALAKGQRVICTRVCGIEAGPCVTIVPHGDVALLTEAIQGALESSAQKTIAAHSH
jgi:hypothetical protein